MMSPHNSVFLFSIWFSGEEMNGEEMNVVIDSCRDECSTRR